MILRGFRYKLAPTPEQERAFRQFAGVCRLLYNLALEQQRDHWGADLRAPAKHLGYVARGARGSPHCAPRST